MTHLSLSKLDFSVLGVVALIGLFHLAIPYHGDQAFFTVGALEISNGKILYRDFWDLKQPGIFYFYFLAGKFFGFTEIGIHTFELLYMLTFCVVLLITLKPHFKNSKISSFIPLLTVGVYYSAAGFWHLTQLEPLVNFPIFLALWLALHASDLGKPGDVASLFFAGVMGGLALFFKLMLLLVLVPIWLVALLKWIFSRKGSPYKALFSFTLPLMAGVILPWGIFLVYAVQHGILPILHETFLAYPPRILAEVPLAGIDRLQDGLIWFFQNFVGLIVFSAIGVYASYKTPKNLINLCLILWFISGLVTIELQRQSLWQYHYLLVFSPLGILTAIGLDFIWQNSRLSLLKGLRFSAICLLSMLLWFNLINLKSKMLILAKHQFALNYEQRLSYQKTINSQYELITQEVRFLAQSDSLPGDIYVAGNPLFYFLGKREQATRLNGWALEFFLPEQWKQLAAEIQRTRPVYILIGNEYAELFRNQHSDFQELLEKFYRPLRVSNLGKWYVLKSEIVSV